MAVDDQMVVCGRDDILRIHEDGTCTVGLAIEVRGEVVLVVGSLNDSQINFSACLDPTNEIAVCSVQFG